MNTGIVRHFRGRISGYRVSLQPYGNVSLLIFSFIVSLSHCLVAPSGKRKALHSPITIPPTKCHPYARYLKEEASKSSNLYKKSPVSLESPTDLCK